MAEERFNLDGLTPEKRAKALALLQYTQAEIESYESSKDPIARATLEGEAQHRHATFTAALQGSIPALKIWARVIERRRFQERLENGYAQLGMAEWRDK